MLALNPTADYVPIANERMLEITADSTYVINPLTGERYNVTEVVKQELERYKTENPDVTAPNPYILRFHLKDRVSWGLCAVATLVANGRDSNGPLSLYTLRSYGGTVVLNETLHYFPQQYLTSDRRFGMIYVNKYSHSNGEYVGGEYVVVFDIATGVRVAQKGRHPMKSAYCSQIGRLFIL